MLRCVRSVSTLYNANIERSSTPHQGHLSTDSINEINSPSFNDAEEIQQDPGVSTSQSRHSIYPVQVDHVEEYQTIKNGLVYKAFTPLQVDLTEEYQDAKNSFDGKAHQGEVESRPEIINRDLTTRNLSIVGLVVGWCTGVAVIAVGVSMIVAGRKPVPEFLINTMMVMAR
jgi:hypothetical protein